MPKERYTLSGMLSGDEPGPLARIRHNLSGKGEGDWGEDCIEKLLKNRVSGAAFFRNVYVPVYNRTTELDIVMASRVGIWIFESKAYGGKIYGKAGEMQWVQYIGSRQNPFYNPVKQNENHRKYLAKALWIPESKVMSFVVFENRADLTHVSPKKGRNYTVCSRKDLPEALAAAASGKREPFSPGVFQRVCGQLKEWSNTALKEAHIQQVQARMFGDACPVCGKKLARREGKHGAFIGCTGYPQCRYTRSEWGINPNSDK